MNLFYFVVVTVLCPFLSLPRSSYYAHALNLPINDFNLVIVTDVHSWVGSHRLHEPNLNADYGHVLSFVEHLRNILLPDKNKNLFFLMNGDFMDGTGLSTYPPTHLTPILQHMNFDAMTVGNHELYHDSTVKHMRDSGFLQALGDRYITSNVDQILNESVSTTTTTTASTTSQQQQQQQLPLGGSRFKILKGPDANVLVFGFLYNFENNCPSTTVSKVQDVVKTDWFQSALTRQSYDAIVVLAHMDLVDSLVYVIMNSIRKVNPLVPIQFVTGHTHYRGQHILEDRAATFEAGRYLDTVGFVSFNKINHTHPKALFQHVFLDANVKTLKETLGFNGNDNDNDNDNNQDSFLTDNGKKIQNMIAQARNSLELDTVYGCSPQHLYLENGLLEKNSLWGFFLQKVVHEFYLQGAPNSVYAQGVGAFRYDLFSGNVTLDDLKVVNPFDDVIYLITRDLKGSELLEVFGGNIHQGRDRLNAALPPYATTIQNVDPEQTYEFYGVDFDLPHFVEAIEKATGKNVTPEAQSMSTTNLWLEFVKSEWGNNNNNEYCQEVEQQQEEKGMSFSMLLGVVASIFGLAVIFMLIRNRWIRARRSRSFAPVESSNISIDGEDYKSTEFI